ncbi:lipoprotein [Vibrio maritimus]|uniref:Lipoprotein n=1 Tax=Vibrio maritimus TaxID=990268 RepID=A0A090SZW2_9VIBR|nr:lipoprotein [Vibrio maritimus]
MQSAITGKKSTLFAVFVSSVFLFGCSSAPKDEQVPSAQEATVAPIASQPVDTSVESTSAPNDAVSNNGVDTSQTSAELGSEAPVGTDVYDPFEGFNRAMFTFNYDYLDPYFVRPVSLAYVNYTLCQCVLA